MKIACICNINHMQFTIARYLRDLGYDVTLFLLEEYEHFKPQNDTFGNIEGIEIKELAWTSENFWLIPNSEIANTFKNYDFLIGSEWAPAFLARVNRFLNIYIPIGADLIEYPFNYSKEKSWIFWKWQLKYKSLLQYYGIKGCGKTFVNKNGDMKLEEAFEKMGFDPKKRYNFSLPGIYLPDLEQAAKQKQFKAVKQSIEELKSQGFVCIISPNRVSYTMDGIHNKGTDILLHGFSLLKQNSDLRFKLFLTNYGTDINAAKELIDNLGLRENIEWLPLMPRKILIPLFRYFDVGFGNLKQVAYLSGISMEMTAIGLPVYQLGADAPADCVDVPIMPYQKVGTAAEIAEQMSKRFELKQEMQVADKGWYENYVVKPALLALNSAINNPRNYASKAPIALWLLKYKNALLGVISPVVYKLSK